MSVPRFAIHRPVTMFMVSAIVVLLGVSGVIVVCRRSSAWPAPFRPCPRSRFPLGLRVTIWVTSLWDSLFSLSVNPTEVPRWFFNSKYALTCKIEVIPMLLISWA
mgnify:CR=1 FL=1